MTPTRAYRNNNPGNLRRGPAWTGQLTEADYATVKRDPEFAQFKTMEYGIRALYMQLITYWLTERNKNRIKSIRDIIFTFAPPNENHSETYLATVAKATGFDVERKDYTDSEKRVMIPKLARAMALVEMGRADLEKIPMSAWENAKRLVPVEYGIK